MTFYDELLKNKILILGIILQFIPVFSMAIALSELEEDYAERSVFLFSDDELNHSDESQLMNINDIIMIEELFSNEVLGTDSVVAQLQDLIDSIYFEDNKKVESQVSDRPQMNSQNLVLPLNSFNENENMLKAFFESMENNQEFRQQIIDTLNVLRDVRNSLTIEKEITFSSSEQETAQFIERNFAEQSRLLELDSDETDSNFTKVKHNTPIFRDFFTKMFYFFLYVVAAIICLKLIILFVLWQRKLNKF